MKCSPFSRGFRKGSKHMHHHRGRFMKHLMRRSMDGYESSSSSSSGEECHRDQQTESVNDVQYGMEHNHGMRHGHKMHGSKHNHGMMNGMKHGHMMQGRKHDHGMMQGRKHGHGMKHGMRHGHMMQERKHDHGMMQGRKHDHGMMHGHMMHGHGMMHGMRHGHDMMHGMRHGHGMKHWHDNKHGKRHDEHVMEHRMKHRHGMKHKMQHGHGKKHKMGHGPGMQHKLKHRFEKPCPDKRPEESPLDVDIENMNKSSESEAFTFYKPKTNAQVVNENNEFKISLETSYYQPGEVSVKIVDGKIDVSAMHESMEDNIYEFHEMYRSFDIPNNVNPEVITSRLDADGKLIIEAACSDHEESSPNERDVPVIRVSE